MDERDFGVEPSNEWVSEWNEAQDVVEYDDPMADEMEQGPEDHFRDDVEADSDTLASAGYGTDEDYGYFGGDKW